MKFPTSIPCPYCGQPVALVWGATIVRDQHGGLVLSCPRCKSKRGLP